MAPHIHIVTDSTCDFPGKIPTGVAVVPLYVLIGEDDPIPETELSTDEFWENVRAMREIDNKATPKTSQPNPIDFEKAFRNRLKTDDRIICITIAKELSGTFDSARQAAKSFSPRQITVIDSGTISCGIWYLVEKAVKKANSGTEYEDIVKELEAMNSRITLLAVLDTVEFVIGGGRLSALAPVLGRLTKVMNVKSIIKIEQGRSSLIQGTRTTNRAVSRLTTLIEKIKKDGGLEKISVIYTQGATDPQGFAERLSKKFNLEVPAVQTGAVLSCHGGPKVIGVVALSKR